MVKEGIKTIENYDLQSSGILNYHVLEGIADLVRVVDYRGIIIYANKAMKDTLGHHIVGIKCNEAHCQPERCAFCITERSIATGEVYQKEDYLNNNYYSIKSSPVRDHNGVIFGAVEVFRNVTRERMLEKELINKNEKMNEDLRFAKKIQKKMLPEKTNNGTFELDYIYRASEMLSGDMFDMYNIDDENIGIYISDVAGNGVAASMMTMFVRQTMRVMKDEKLSPSKTLKKLHRRFKNLNLDIEHYFTLFYGIYNKTSGVFTYSNAGHNCYPIKFDRDFSNYELLKAKGFPVISLLDDIDYKEYKVKLNPGDKVLLYTDGVTEARNSIGKEFELEGVLNVLKSKPKNILKSIEQEVINYSWGEQEDDLAIVLLQIN